MKRILVIMLILCWAICAVRAYAGTSTVTLAWDPSAPIGDVAGYRVYKSLTAGQYTTGAANAACSSLVGINTCTASGVTDGKWYFVATAYDSAGNESRYSNEVSRTFDSTAPPAPGNMRVTVTVVVDLP